MKNSRNGKFEFEFLSRNKINLLYIIDKNQNRDLIYSVMKDITITIFNFSRLDIELWCLAPLSTIFCGGPTRYKIINLH